MKQFATKHELQQLLAQYDPNQCWQMIYETLGKAANEHCPQVQSRLRTNTTGHLNDELIELQQDRDYLRQKSERTNDPEDKSIAKCIIKKMRNEVRKAKARYCQDQLYKHRQTARKCWHELKPNRTNKQTTISNLINEESGDLIPDGLRSEEINIYFIDI